MTLTPSNIRTALSNNFLCMIARLGINWMMASFCTEEQYICKRNEAYLASCAMDNTCTSFKGEATIA